MIRQVVVFDQLGGRAAEKIKPAQVEEEEGLFRTVVDVFLFQRKQKRWLAEDLAARNQQTTDQRQFSSVLLQLWVVSMYLTKARCPLALRLSRPGGAFLTPLADPLTFHTPLI